jgi:hypothetical protein
MATMVTMVTPALASAQTRIVIDDFRGPSGGVLRSDAVRTLRHVDEVAVVARRDADVVARRFGIRRVTRGPHFVRVGSALDVRAFVVGSVRRGRQWQARVRIIDASSGRVVSDARYFGRGRSGLRASLRASFARDIERALDGIGDRGASGSMSFSESEAFGASAPAPASASASAVDMDALEREAPPPVVARTMTAEEELASLRRERLDPELFPDDERPASPASRGEAFTPRHAPLEAEAGLRLVNRGLAYRDDPTGSRRPYDLPLGSALALDATYYPGAHFTNDALAHVGLTVAASHSLFLSSAGPNGRRAR